MIAAKTVRSIWLITFDPDNVEKTKKLSGFEDDLVDSFTMDYEEAQIQLLRNYSDEIKENSTGYNSTGYKLYVNVHRSFVDLASGAVEHDIGRMMSGYILMFFYTLFTLGKLNLVEHKFLLAMSGIASVFFGVIVSVGITMAFGLLYTPMHGLLPFICLGIGIDDMFIIIRCFNNIPDKKQNTLAENMGTTLQHAGVSITVTTLTDVFAFSIGAFTVFPALHSFATCCAIAILTIFIFQTSWFVAWLTIDHKRIEQKRDGFIPCIIHEKWEPTPWSQKDIGNLIMSKVAMVLEIRAVQACIIIITFGMLGASILATTKIRVEYDFLNLLPRGSYLLEWMDRSAIDFPDDGRHVSFYTLSVPYTVEDLGKIDQLVSDLNDTVYNEGYLHWGKKLPKLVSTGWEHATGFWWTDFKAYIKEHKKVKDWREMIEKDLMPRYLSDFLFHEDGSMNTYDFRWDGDLMCNEPAPNITSSKLGTMKFHKFTGPSEHLPARQKIDEILNRTQGRDSPFPVINYDFIYELDYFVL